MNDNEKFFRLYLEENKLKFKKIKDIYLVKLDKVHKKWLNKDTLKCKIDDMHSGTPVFDMMLSRHINEPVFSRVMIKDDKDALDTVNERLNEIKEKITGDTSYNIEEIRKNGLLILFETNIRTASKAYNKEILLLKVNNLIVPAKDITKNEFYDIDDKNNDNTLKNLDSEINLMLDYLKKHMKKDIDKIKKEHTKDMNELLEIQRRYSEEQFLELQKEEDVFLTKIEELRDSEINARTFEIKHNIAEKIKKLKLKHQRLIESNKKTREKIKETFKQETASLNVRDIKFTTEIKILAHVNLQVLKIAFPKDNYIFIPALNEFFHRNLQKFSKKTV